MKPMLSQSLEVGLPKHANQWARVVEGKYIMQPKLDGWRVLLDFREAPPHAWTRSGRDIIDRLWPWLETIQTERYLGMVLDCEIGYPVSAYEIDFNATARVLGSGPDEAIRKWKQNLDKGRNLAAWVFDIPTLWETIQCHRSDLVAQVCPENDPLRNQIVHVIDLGSWDEDVYTKLCADYHAEGVVLKNPEALWVPDTRPTQTWYKVKKFETADAVIVGYDDGKGKYAGQVGAIVFQLQDGRVGRCSGMDDATRLMLSHSRDKFLGMWIEVRFFGLTAGTPRHPQFVRFRTDRS